MIELENVFKPKKRVFVSLTLASAVIGAMVIYMAWRVALPGLEQINAKLPVVFGGVEAGISAVDPLLLELAAVYRLPAARRLRRIYVPAVLPQFLAAVRTSIGLAWKAGVDTSVCARGATEGLPDYDKSVIACAVRTKSRH